MLEIRKLEANEIDVRVQSVKQNGCVVLLYKDARCDMRILDEVFGPLGWEREHQVINGNLFCTVRVWDEQRKRWVSKQDVGTESNEDKEKGQASDSFKRACFNLGIGRELYTAPFTWINLDQSEVVNKGNNKFATYTKFKVSEIGYNDRREINKLVIVDSKGKVRFTLGDTKTTDKTKTEVTTDYKDEVAEAAAHIITFGKNKGKTLKEIYKSDEKSWAWLLDNSTGETRRCISIMLEALNEKKDIK